MRRLQIAGMTLDQYLSSVDAALSQSSTLVLNGQHPRAFDELWRAAGYLTHAAERVESDSDARLVRHYRRVVANRLAQLVDEL